MQRYIIFSTFCRDMIRSTIYIYRISLKKHIEDDEVCKEVKVYCSRGESEIFRCLMFYLWRIPEHSTYFPPVFSLIELQAIVKDGRWFFNNKRRFSHDKDIYIYKWYINEVLKEGQKRFLRLFWNKTNNISPVIKSRCKYGSIIVTH